MSFTLWRGVTGLVKPTRRPGTLEELIRMLPEGIGVLPLFLNIREGTTDEFKRATAPYEPMVKQLADAGCDLIHPEGAPPFMLLGYKGEAELLRKLELLIFDAGYREAREAKIAAEFRPRSWAVVCGQAPESKAARAACTARSTSFSSASGTSAMISSVEGS